MHLLTAFTGIAVLPAILAAQVATVEVTPPRTTVTAGGSTKLTFVARDSSGRALAGQQVTWATAPFDVAAIDANGNLRAFNPGQAQVFAIVGGKTGRAVVEVGPKAPASVRVAVTPATVVVGGLGLVTATPETEDGLARKDVPVTWRSMDERIATVGSGGMVSGLAPGRARIVAESGPARGEVTVTVIANPVSRVTVSGPATGRTGDVLRFAARGADASGRAVADPPVRWSVSAPGAAIDADGGFVAEQAGTYVVTGTVGGAAAAAAVVVSPRVHTRRLEQVAFSGFGDVQAGEVWAVGNVVYVSTISDRVYTFDISTPGQPRKVDSIMVDAHIVNDISTTPDGKIGLLTREGASSRRNGIVFLDLAEPLHPKVLSEYTTTVTGGVHSAYIDGHYVYLTDDATGSMRVIDFSNVRSPKEVARWEVTEKNLLNIEIMPGMTMSAGRMLHDIQVRDGLAYLAYWRHGLVILDVGAGIKGGSPGNPQLVSRFTYNVGDFYPPEYIAGTHAVFRQGKYVFVADEVFPPIFDLASKERIKSLGMVHVLDVSDVASPRKVAEYNVKDMGSHNLWVENDVLYIGYYEGGLRAVDVSGELRGDLMAQGREIGSVWTGSSQGFRPNLPMAWGAQPHRGFIYVSDINSGLWVARLTPVVTP